MPHTFPRELFTKDESKIIFDALAPGFHTESLRPSREQGTYLAPDTIAHVLYRTTEKAIPTPEGIHNIDDLPMPDDIRARLNAKLDWVENYVNERTDGYLLSFLIASSDMCGYKKNIKHVHPIVQNDPPRCMVWSFPIPLYIDETSDERAGFYWNSQPDLFPKVVYMSHRRMRELKVDYNKAEIPKDGKLINFMFDAARCPHWVDFTPHMYLWLVFEGVDFNREFLAKDPVTGLYMDLI